MFAIYFLIIDAVTYNYYYFDTCPSCDPFFVPSTALTVVGAVVIGLMIPLNYKRFNIHFNKFKDKLVKNLETSREIAERASCILQLDGGRGPGRRRARERGQHDDRCHAGYQNVQVTLNHDYVALNSTTLNRTISVTASNLKLTTGQLIFYPWYSGAGFADQEMLLRSDMVQKSSFFTSSTVGFVAYFDNTLQPGQDFPATFDVYFSDVKYNASILAKTSTDIVAAWQLNESMNQQNGTYIADSTGQVRSFTYAGSFTTFFPYIRAYSYSFTREVENPSITSPSAAICTQGTTGHSIS
jgi:hypothetical protein